MEATKSSLESIKYGEDLMESLENCYKFKLECESYKISIDKFNALSKSLRNDDFKPEKPQIEFMLKGNNIFEHMMERIKKIRHTEVENSLKFLNFGYVKKFLYFIEYYIRNVSSSF